MPDPPKCAKLNFNVIRATSSTKPILFALARFFLPSLCLLTSIVHGDPIVRRLELPASDRDADTVFLEFHAGGKLDAEASGLAIVDENEKPVPYRLMSHDTEGPTTAAIDLSGSPSAVFVHYGTARSDKAIVDKNLPVSLVMQTFSIKQGGFRNVPDLLRKIESAKPRGTSLIDKISFAHNPFDRNTNFVTDIQGLLRVKRNGNFRIFSVHDDAAFVFIDGRLVISRSEPNLVRNRHKLAEQAVQVPLDQGTHRVRYIHVQRGETSMALLGMMTGQRALPVPRDMFVHHPPARLGPARSVGDDVPVGFDVDQLDQLSHDQLLYTRFRIAPIASAPADSVYSLRFGDGSTRSLRNGRSVDHVLVSHIQRPTDSKYGKMTLELKDQNGRVRDKAISFLRPRVLGHFSSVRDRQQLLAHAQAIAAGRYDQAEEDSILALFRLVENTERPALMAPLAEPFVRRFGKRRSKVMDSMKYALATYIASNDPHRAADLFADLARSAEDSWQGACAAAEYLDLLFFRISETQDPVRFITPLLGGRTRREVALLKARRGDLHRVAGDAERALKAYRDAQRVAYRELDRRQAAVLQSAYRETALSYLQQERYPALRDLLFQWEADFPAGKLGGDLPLLTGRYYQAVGDPKRARIEYETILKLNPLHSRAPEITFRLAQSLDDLGEKDEARAKFATVVRQYPNSPFARNARYEVHP